MKKNRMGQDASGHAHSDVQSREVRFFNVYSSIYLQSMCILVIRLLSGTTIP